MRLGPARSAAAVALALAAGCAPLAAQESAPEDLNPDGVYVAASGGWAWPLGPVSGMTDLVRFESPMRAKELYGGGPTIGLRLGRPYGDWTVELDVLARIPPLTDRAHALVDPVGPDADREVDVEYATFELVGGRRLDFGAPTAPRASIIAALGAGIGVMHLSQGTGIEPFNDTGGSASLQVAAQLRLAARWAARATARYQLLALGVDIPHDVAIHLGISLTPRFGVPGI